MAKITRVFQKIFGGEAPLSQVGQFGSFSNNAPMKSKDPSVIQALANWTTGWYSAIRGAYSPTIQDMNGVLLVLSYQLAYILQQGVAEWDEDTTYYKNSMVNYAGTIYISLTDDNTGNPVGSPAYWGQYGNNVKTITGVSDYEVLLSDNIIRVDGVPTVFLPLIAEVPTGKSIRIKNLTEFPVAIYAGELMDGVNEVVATLENQSLEFISNGVDWDIF